jgi:hypothetical protein
MMIFITLSCAFYAAPIQHLPYDYTILMDGASCECIYDHTNKVWMSCEHIRETGCYDPEDDMGSGCNAWIEEKQSGE